MGHFYVQLHVNKQNEQYPISVIIVSWLKLMIVIT